MKKDPNKYPKGLNAAKVKKIIDYYEHQSDDEAVREMENARFVKPTKSREATVWIEVPERLLGQVKQLIAGHSKSSRSL